MSWLKPNDQSIHGLATIDPAGDMSLTQLTIRLPATLQSLTPLLIHYEEHNRRTPESR
jgi:hypothetical protein